MGRRHDVSVIDERTATKCVIDQQQRHPRVLVHVRGIAADDADFFPQSAASLNDTNTS